MQEVRNRKTYKKTIRAGVIHSDKSQFESIVQDNSEKDSSSVRVTISYPGDCCE